MSVTRCAPFWIEHPNILWEEATDFYPFHPTAQKCTSTALNSLTRFGIYLGLVLSILRFNVFYFGLTFGICIISIAAYYGMKSQGKVREGFVNEDKEKEKKKEKTIVAPTLFLLPTEGRDSIYSEKSELEKDSEKYNGEDEYQNLVGGVTVADRPVNDVIGKTDRTLPTGPNPFMNLLINEVKDNPKKPPALNVDTPKMARSFSDKFQTPVYNDPGDVFQHTQNQRTWVVQPNTSIPNDRDSYQNWLYRVPGRTCKEGNNAACRSGTEGTAVTWLSSL